MDNMFNLWICIYIASKYSELFGEEHYNCILFGDQQLVTNFSSVFVILVSNHVSLGRLIEVHSSRT